MNLHTGLFNGLDISSQNFLGQAIFRNTEQQHAAGSALRLKHINLIAGKCQIITAGQSAGTGTDDSDTLAVLGPYRLLYKLAVICFIRNEALHIADRHRIIVTAAVTGGLARMRADSAANRRERIVSADETICTFVVTLSRKGYVARNMMPAGQVVLAGGNILTVTRRFYLDGTCGTTPLASFTADTLGLVHFCYSVDMGQFNSSSFFLWNICNTISITHYDDNAS